MSIKIDNLSFSYNCENPIIANCNLSIEDGEFVGLIGGVGSGKSTLLRLIDALLDGATGSITVNGFDASDKGSLPLMHRDVGFLFQNPALQLVMSTVEEDVAFGLSNVGIDNRESGVMVQEIIEQLSILYLSKQEVHTLSGGETQRVALAGLLVMQPKILLLDEPTSMLDPVSRESLLSLLKQLNAQGTTIVMVTHNMEDLLVADRVILMQNATVGMDVSIEYLPQQREVLASQGFALPFSMRSLSIDEVVNSLKTTAVSVVQDAVQASVHIKLDSVDYMVNGNLILQNITTHINAGELVGIVGESGAGKSTLSLLFSGLILPTSGTVIVDDVDSKSRNFDRRRSDIAVVFQNPDDQFFENTVYDEIAFSLRNNGYKESAIRERILECIEQIGIPQSMLERSPFTLSGGQKKKVTLASALVARPKLLIVDEPTSALNSKDILYMKRLLKEQKRRGVTVIVVTHDLDLLLSLCERVLYLENTNLLYDGSTQGFFDEVLTDEFLSTIEEDKLRFVREVQKTLSQEGAQTSTLNQIFDAVEELQW